MTDKTLVYMTFRDGCVSLRTVSRSRKSPHRFYIPCQELEGLEHKPEVIVHDIYSFAMLRRDAYAGQRKPAWERAAHPWDIDSDMYGCRSCIVPKKRLDINMVIYDKSEYWIAVSSMRSRALPPCPCIVETARRYAA